MDKSDNILTQLKPLKQCVRILFCFCVSHIFFSFRFSIFLFETINYFLKLTIPLLLIALHSIMC
jgi:hypothetical protein